jgi:hypothetical protein
VPAGGRRREKTKHELRCFCLHKPLLAVYGVDEKGRLYVHQRVFKQGRIFGETVFYGGTVALLCRECYRWNEIVIRNPPAQAVLTPIEMPEMLRPEVGSNDSLPNDQSHS